jgi:diguanylate cyclase (GGDEF)-like protein
MMWILTIFPPLGEPIEYHLKPGKTLIGRNLDNDIVLTDISASRVHAELLCEGDEDVITIRDLGSTNGTWVNRHRLDGPSPLGVGDQIRIGGLVASIYQRSQQFPVLPDTQPLTRDLLLESVDQHAILLHEVAKRLNTVLDLDMALAEVSELVRTALRAAKCEVILAERFAQLPELGFPTYLANQAIEQRSIVSVADVPNQAPSHSAHLLRLRSALCMPLMRGNDVIALLYVYKTDPEAKPFDQHDVLLAVAIGHQAALTIERMRLLNLSMRDPLTNLYNRRYLEEALEREGQLATRRDTVVGIIMLDLDHFKDFNDTFGHDAGDMLLRELAKLLSSRLRGSDIACRYGGEEFVLLLPDAPLEEVQRLAEEMRHKARGLSFVHEGKTLGMITFSSGVAVFPDHGLTMAAVLRAADAALYQAKQNGRDRVCQARRAEKPA